MKACSDRNEELLLHCLEELPREKSSSLEKHLEKCYPCQRERERITHMLKQVKNAFPTRTLPQDKYGSLFWAIKRELKGKAKTSWWKRPTFGLPNRFLPAVAASCLVVAFVGWYGMGVFRSPTYPGNIAKLKPVEQMIVKDLDFIKNLELLQEMDTLQKLVQVVVRKNVI